MPKLKYTSPGVGYLDTRYVNVTGDTMTGQLAINPPNTEDGISIVGKYGAYLEQDEIGGYALYAYRGVANLSSSYALGTFYIDDVTDAAPVLEVHTSGTGMHITTGDTNEDLIIKPKRTTIIRPHALGDKSLIVQGLASQTANIQEWQDSDSAVTMSVKGFDSTTFFQINKADTTNVLTVDTTNGRVGIGTTAPYDMLDLVGGRMRVNEARADNLHIGMRNDDGITNPMAWMGVDTSGNYHFGDNAGTPLVTFQQAGNVGIGTTGPTQKLDVGGRVSLSGDVLWEAAVDEGLIFHHTTGGLTFTGQGDTYDFLFINDAGDNVFGVPTGTQVGYFPGNVGIGVTDPDTKLEVFNAGNQLKLSFDATDNAIFAVDTNGDLTITPSGTKVVVSGNIVGNQIATPLQTATLGVGVTTLAITSNVLTLTGDGGGNTLATLTGGVAGQLLTIIFVDGLVTITDTAAHTANTVDLSAAFTSADDTVLQLVSDGTSWYEVSRSVN